MIGFDLRPLSTADADWKRGRLVFVVVLLISVAAELLVFVWSERAAFSGPSWATASGVTSVALIFAAVAFVSFALAGLPRLLPGAESLTVDARGVHLFYRNAGREDFPWTDRSGFLLRDLSALPDVARAGRAFSVRGARYWRRRTLLTRAAFDAILSEARARGAKVSAPGERVAPRGRPIRQYRVRADARGPRDPRGRP